MLTLIIIKMNKNIIRINHIHHDDASLIHFSVECLIFKLTINKMLNGVKMEGGREE